MAFGSTLSETEDSATARKARGAFFTPHELSDYLARWAIRSVNDVVLEPSCGEAQFLLSSLKRLQFLGASQFDASEQVVGCELHEQSAVAARNRCAAAGYFPEVRVGDFFDLVPDSSFDAVLGNPPYVRYQSIDDGQRKAMQVASSRNGLMLSGLSSAWAPFVVHACSFLKTGGRVAFVLPAELLTVNYAASIRSFFTTSFSAMELVTFDERVFPEVQEEVVLLLASGYRQGETGYISWRQCAGIADIDEVACTRFYPEERGARWSRGLVPERADACLREVEALGFDRLSAWGNISLGSVTGNNKFFALSRKDVQKWGLGQEDVVNLCPPGSRHVRTIALTSTGLSALTSAGKRTQLFYPAKKPSAAAYSYICFGEEQGVADGYKCSKRTPWWRVPVSGVPDAFVTYMNDFAPSICANEARAYCLNSVHGLTFAESVADVPARLFSLACVNSATLLSAEMEGRAYGGGLLKLEPREAARLLGPSAALVRACTTRLVMLEHDACKALNAGEVRAASDLVDAVLFAELGFGADELAQLRLAKQKLYGRRHARARRG